jgi:hypothetical protein
MTAVRAAAVMAALLATGVPAASGQSLDEIARREAERRKSIKSSGKVLTNESLRRELPPPPAPGAPATAAPAAEAAGAPATPAGATAPAAPAAEAAAAPAAAANTEADWRKRMTDARAALQRSQTFAEALQTRVNALSTDFVNRDDPAQRSVIAADRQKTLAELDRVKQDIASQQKAIATIQDDARKAGIPAGWVR